MEEKGLHDGHRKRVRQSFLDRNIDSMPDHEILEMILFYAYPRRDTNEIAHRLINTFGNLEAVMNAAYEDLLQVKDVGENAATLIVLFSRYAKRYMMKSNELKKEFTEEEIMNFLKSRLSHERNEVVVSIFCDNKGQFIKTAEIDRGTSTETAFRTRELVEAAIRCGASKVIISHNHPKGFAVPSQADVNATVDLKDIFAQLDIELIDHIIVADDDCFSMRMHKKYNSIF
ncbi:MAG: DNA repair protein RadC [Clostridia bacterium]|nr:DNA repair protein RadC [Clostridia bacterium]